GRDRDRVEVQAVEVERVLVSLGPAPADPGRVARLLRDGGADRRDQATGAGGPPPAALVVLPAHREAVRDDDEATAGRRRGGGHGSARWVSATWRASWRSRTRTSEGSATRQRAEVGRAGSPPSTTTTVMPSSPISAKASSSVVS